jgi:ribosome-associated protein
MNHLNNVLNEQVWSIFGDDMKHQVSAEQLKNIAIDALEDIKGKDIKVFGPFHDNTLFEYVVIASGTSSRQCRALAESVYEKIKALGIDIFGVEGARTSDWVLVDCGSVVVHVMHPDARAYYRLEEIWSGKPPTAA